MLFYVMVILLQPKIANLFQFIIKMGNQQSRGNQSDIQINHQKFTKSSLVKSLQKELLQIHLTTDQKNYDLWKKLSSKIQPQKYPHLILPLNHSYSSNGLCSSSGSAKLTYQNYPYLLEDEIQKIKKKKSTFSECQIWKLLLSIVSAKKQFWKISPHQSNKLGDIRPKNIFLNQKGDVKVVNLLSWPNEIDNYGKYFYHEASYLAPEDLQKIQLGVMKNPQNQKSQIFSIGFTLLSLGLTQNFQNIYDLSKHQINQKKFKSKIIQWKTTLYFSQILRALVVNMLQFQPEKRLSFQELDKFLQPHQININGMRPLVIQNAPNKLHAQVSNLIKQLPIIIQQRFQKSEGQKLTKRTVESVINRNISNPQSFKPSNKNISQENKFKFDPIPFSPRQNISITNLPQKQQIPSSNFLLSKQNVPLNQIAARLIKQQNIQHADSLVDETSDRGQQIQSLYSGAKPSSQHLSQKRFISTIPNVKQPQKSQIKENLSYHTYVDIIINAPYDKCWDQFLKMLENPGIYSKKYSQIVKAQKINNQHIISSGNAKVKVELNVEEGKAHFTSIGSEDQGQILGGVSRKQNGLSQIWFNSAYNYKKKPFPFVQQFNDYLNQMKKNLEK